MTHPTWGDKPPRVDGGNPAMRPDQLMQITRTRAGSGPAPQTAVVIARVILVGGGSPTGVFVYDPTIGFGNLVGWVTDSATDPFGNPDHPVIGAGNPATGASTFLTKNANIHFSAPGMTNDGEVGAALQGAGSVPYPAPSLTVTAPDQTGSSGQMTLILLGGNTAATKGPFALLGPANVGGVAGQYYGNQECWYTPGTTGVTDDGAAISALFALGIPKVTILPGTGTFAAGSLVMSPGQELCGSGFNETIINGSGTGAVIQQTNTGAYSSTQIGGSIGGPLGMTVDITGMGAGSIGVEVGNFAGGHLNVEVRDTGGTTPANIGIYFNNSVHFTEQWYVERGWVHGCTIVFDVTGATTSTNSFKGLWANLYVNQAGVAANDGLVLQNGANVYDSTVKYTGNFSGQVAAVTSAAIRITGTVPAGHPGAGGGSRFSDCQLQFGPECSTGTSTPQTIIFGAGTNVIVDCAGVMDFNSNFTASNYTGGGSFFGPIAGDSVLAPLGRLAHPLTLDQGLNLGHGAAAQALVNGSTITTSGNYAAYAPCSLAAAVTGIIMAVGTFDGQMCFVANEAAVASGFSITFAGAGSHVGNPATVINPSTGALFVWNVHVSEWLRAQLGVVMVDVHALMVALVECSGFALAAGTGFVALVWRLRHA